MKVIKAKVPEPAPAVETAICPGCDLRRTIYEYLVHGLRMKFCRVCRDRYPARRRVQR